MDAGQLESGSTPGRGGLLRACQEAAQKVKDEEAGSNPEETCDGKVPERTEADVFSLPRFEGSALYPCVALSNHSCLPNFTMRYSDGALADMMAVRDIQAGDELNLAYVSPSLPLPERVGSLWKTWGFVCTCRRCQDEVMMRAVAAKPERHVPSGLQLSAAGIAAAMAVRNQKSTKQVKSAVNLGHGTQDATESDASEDAETVSSSDAASSEDDVRVDAACNAPFSGPLVPDSVTKIEAAMREMMADLADLPTEMG
eukprot:Skav233018  [mRNA]  locus=scaffold909:212230:220056:+ [translate_table: standard]